MLNKIEKKTIVEICVNMIIIYDFDKIIEV